MPMSCCDPALIFWFEGGRISGLVCVHVDDFFGAGSDNFYDSVMLKSWFVAIS